MGHIDAALMSNPEVMVDYVGLILPELYMTSELNHLLLHPMLTLYSYHYQTLYHIFSFIFIFLNSVIERIVRASRPP